MKTTGLHIDRTTTPGGSAGRERVFAEQWQREQDRGLLALLLMRDAKRGDPGAFVVVSGLGPTHATKPLGDVTERDAVIAATVVQWLGTNVGFLFLEQTLARAGYELRPKVKK